MFERSTEYPSIKVVSRTADLLTLPVSNRTQPGPKQPLRPQVVPPRAAFLRLLQRRKRSTTISGRRRINGSGRRFQTALGLDEPDDAIEPLALLQICHDEGACTAHALGISLHLFQRGADVRREVDLVDHQKVGAGDAWTTL